MCVAYSVIALASQPSTVLLVMLPVLLLAIPSAIHHLLTSHTSLELLPVGEHEVNFLTEGTTFALIPLIEGRYEVWGAVHS